ncbi:hypothetical protein B0H17DRAFT_1147011 [Mycena rosella]|uniref:Uncharacterized protein n=1 Tax=Mycena rosella TaxID=1033263 RepID=A0AAD7G0N5_MYCRO|nr:hypothetical protein B0H17DRAFT_1147011 [Mycena rosella]
MAALCGVGELLRWGGRLWSAITPTADTPFLIQCDSLVIKLVRPTSSAACYPKTEEIFSEFFFTLALNHAVHERTTTCISGSTFGWAWHSLGYKAIESASSVRVIVPFSKGLHRRSTRGSSIARTTPWLIISMVEDLGPVKENLFAGTKGLAEDKAGIFVFNDEWNDVQIDKIGSTTTKEDTPSGSG